MTSTAEEPDVRTAPLRRPCSTHCPKGDAMPITLSAPDRRAARIRALILLCASLIAVPLFVVGGLLRLLRPDDVAALALAISTAILASLAIWTARTMPAAHSATDDARRIVWRAHRVAWHQFTQRRRRTLIITEGLTLTTAAAAVPLYLLIAGYQWTVVGGETVREMPPNIDTVSSWALFIAQMGAAFFAILTMTAVGVWLLNQRHTSPALWRRVSAAVWCLALTGPLWALSAITTTWVIFNGLVMT